MKQEWGILPDGQVASLYTISSGPLKAVISDLGATIVQLWVPDGQGDPADIVLGFDTPAEYAASGDCFGATVGRNANRIGGASVVIGGKVYPLTPNDGNNNLHSGPNGYHHRLWQVLVHTPSTITLGLHSPHLDQGFPGNADITVTFSLSAQTLSIRYEALSDRDTIFNLTNHSYFNLAGHNAPEKAMSQLLSMPARFFTPADDHSIPTGECRPVDGTAMDFRVPKPLGQDIHADDEPLHLQNGYDHNFEVFCDPCAILTDPSSGRSMAVCTDCPGIQLYTANYTDCTGKGGQKYPPRSAVCLETQFYPDSVHQSQWPQPLVAAGQKYQSTTRFHFSW